MSFQTAFTQMLLLIPLHSPFSIHGSQESKCLLSGWDRFYDNRNTGSLTEAGNFCSTSWQRGWILTCTSWFTKRWQISGPSLNSGIWMFYHDGSCHWCSRPWFLTPMSLWCMPPFGHCLSRLRYWMCWLKLRVDVLNGSFQGVTFTHSDRHSLVAEYVWPSTESICHLLFGNSNHSNTMAMPANWGSVSCPKATSDVTQGKTCVRYNS